MMRMPCKSPLLGDRRRNDVEKLLAIFRQDHPADEKKRTLIVEETGDQPALVTDILRNLHRLVEEPEVKRKMAAEDEMYEALNGKSKKKFVR